MWHNSFFWTRSKSYSYSSLRRYVARSLLIHLLQLQLSSSIFYSGYNLFLYLSRLVNLSRFLFPSPFFFVQTNFLFFFCCCCCCCCCCIQMTNDLSYVADTLPCHTATAVQKQKQQQQQQQHYDNNNNSSSKTRSAIEERKEEFSLCSWVVEESLIMPSISYPIIRPISSNRPPLRFAYSFAQSQLIEKDAHLPWIIFLLFSIISSLNRRKLYFRTSLWFDPCFWRVTMVFAMCTFGSHFYWYFFSVRPDWAVRIKSTMGSIL